MFDFMKIVTLQARYECVQGGTLPAYLGSTIRGILGHCIHEFFCRRRNVKCFLCEDRETCLYAQSFSNTGGEAGAVNPYTMLTKNHLAKSGTKRFREYINVLGGNEYGESCNLQ